MKKTTVLEFAEELKMPADALLEQLNKAGVKKSSSDDTLSAADKNGLLEFLRASHGEAKPSSNRVTLTRKSTSALKAQDATGKTRTVQVEVRKKRVLVKRDTPEVAETPVSAPVEEDIKKPAKAEQKEAPVVEAVVETPPVEETPVVEVTPEVVVETPVVTEEPAAEAKPAPAPAAAGAR